MLKQKSFINMLAVISLKHISLFFKKRTNLLLTLIFEINK